MKSFNFTFGKGSEIKHLKSLIIIQKGIVKTHSRTLDLLKANYTDRDLKSLIEDDLKEAKAKLQSYKEDLKKLES